MACASDVSLTTDAEPAVPAPPVSPAPPISAPPISSAPPAPPGSPAQPGPTAAAGTDTGRIRGRASVPQNRPPRTDTGVVVDPLSVAPDRPWHAPTNEDPRTLKLGYEYTAIGAAFAFVCWGIWAASSGGGNLVGPVIAFLVVLAVAGGLFALSRLIGRLVLVQRMGRRRATARGAHAVTGIFLALAGLAYLRQTPWVVELLAWIRGLF